MTRRSLFGLFAMAAAPVEHKHVWQKSPFYVTCAMSMEEPGFYPPSGLLPVQLCACGALRVVPEAARYLVGKEYTKEARNGTAPN